MSWEVDDSHSRKKNWASQFNFESDNRNIFSSTTPRCFLKVRRNPFNWISFIRMASVENKLAKKNRNMRQLSKMLKVHFHLFCSTSLPLASTRRVQLTLSSLCLSIELSNIKRKVLWNAENQTWGCWVRSKYATSVLLSSLPPPHALLFTRRISASGLRYLFVDFRDRTRKKTELFSPTVGKQW